MKHTPVLLQEVVDNLDVKSDDVVLDATLGSGGHAKSLIEKLGPKGTFVGLDADGLAIEKARKVIGEPKCKLIINRTNFSNIGLVLEDSHLEKIDKALFDLGWGMHTLEHERGFSFNDRSEPLLMTYDSSPNEDTLTAREILNYWSEETLILILKKYGGEGRARQIANEIVKSRMRKAFETVGDLLDCISKVYTRKLRINPATKTFQALRIAVNNELAIIEPSLDIVLKKLSSSGRIAVITFHSTEDTIVKTVFKKWSQAGYGFLLNKHVITATREEQLSNPRSRSAHLRVFQKS